MKQRIAESLGVLILSTLLLFAFYGEIVGRLNEILFSGDGDGIKNYFVAFFPVLHGGPVFLSPALGYPFQEHLIYLDAQPFLVWLLRLAAWSSVPADNWLPGVFNGLLLFSPVASSLALYGIFRNLGHPRALSLSAGCGIAFLSPQLLRILGHYSLAFGVAIPLCWLLLIWSRKKPSFSSSLLVALNTLLWSLVHAYYLALLSLFVGLSWVVRLMRGRRITAISRDSPSSLQWKLLHASLQFFLPVVLLAILIFFTDPYFAARSRGATDFDPTIYRSTPTALLVPWARPLGNGLGVAIEELGSLAEGMSYLGLAVPVILLILLFTRVAGWVGAFRDSPSLSSARNLTPTEVLQREVSLEALLTGLVGLILALGWLWQFQSGWLWEWAGPLRQFRSIGRFSWVCYYAFSVFAFSQLGFLRSRSTRPRVRNLATLMIAVSVSVQLFEAGSQASEITRTVREASVPVGQVLPGRQALMSSPTLPPGVQAGVYQAIFPLPYYHIGSDVDFRYVGRGRSIAVSMALSLRTGLPLLAMHSTRTPLSLTKMSLSLLDRGPELGALKGHFPNRKPFLIVVSGANLTAAEEAILDRARPLGTRGDIQFFEISFEEALSPRLAGASQAHPG